MNNAAYNQWLENREQHRQFLFGDSTDITPPLGNIATAPLAVLNFYQPGGRLSAADRLEEQKLTTTAHAILARHNQMATKNQGGLFAIPNPQNLAHIGDLTGGVLARWERARRRNGLERPFEALPVTEIVDTHFEHRDVQLVVETASAILEIMQLGYNPSPSKNKFFVNLIARRGPVFAAAWARGDIITAHYIQQGKNPKDTLDALPPTRRTEFAFTNPRDPLAAVERFIGAVNGDVSLENIANRLGWDLQKTAGVFTPNTRKHIARLYPRDPLAVVDRVANNIHLLTPEYIVGMTGLSKEDAVAMIGPTERLRLALSINPQAKLKDMADNVSRLTTANLAAELNWSAAEVDQLFTPAYKKRLVRMKGIAVKIYKTAHTFKHELAIANIAKDLGWSETQTAAVFTTATRRRIAFDHSDRPIAAIKNIAGIRQKLLESLTLPIEVINFISSYYSTSKVFAAAQNIQKALDERPPHIAARVWLWTVAQKAFGTKDAWQRSAAAYYKFLRVSSPQSLNTLVGDDKELVDFVPASTDLIASLFEDQPDDYLQALAAKAGVTYRQLQDLLAGFNGQQDTLHPKQQATLDKLRKTVGQQ